MSRAHASLEKLQRMLLEVVAIDRAHRIPGVGRPENVVEHSFSVAMLSWQLFEMVHPPLDIAKILKYALAHDFSERGYKTDVNTFATAQERSKKKAREVQEIRKLKSEFDDFADFTSALEGYEAGKDEEALFVWSVDKLQAIVLGGTIDGWWPYAQVAVSYEAFCKKMEEFIPRCSPYLRDIFTEIVEESKKTYYDRPAR